MEQNNNPRRPLQHPEDEIKIAVYRRIRQLAAETASCCILYRCGVSFAELCSDSRDPHTHNARVIFIAALINEADWNFQGLSALLRKPEKYIVGALHRYESSATESQKFVVSDIRNNIENVLNY